MPRIAVLATMATIAVSGLAIGPASAGTGSLELIADNWAAASASADGTRIAFVSEADGQVYVRDRGTGVDTLVSTANGTTKAADSLPIQSPKISRNGRYVTFVTYARNLDPRDTDFFPDIYLKDTSTGTLTLVSTTSTGVKANLRSEGPAPVSDTGTVVFMSHAGNFPPLAALPSGCIPTEDACLDAEIYAKSLSGELTLVSLGTRGDGEFSAAGSSSVFADISADGTKIAINTGDAMTADDTDGGLPDVFVVDLTTGARTLASSDVPGSSYFPSMSADGSRVAFEGEASILESQVYLRDLSQSGSALVSQNAAGQAANGLAMSGLLSSDGRYLTFSTRATNLLPEDTDAVDDILLKDLTTGTLRLVTVRDDGTKPTTGSGSGPLQVLTGGSGVLFSSSLTTFTNPSDTSGGFGWYLKQLPPLPPPPPADGNGDGILDSLQPSGTATGAFVDASTTPITHGNVVNTDGLTVSIADATDPADGVLVTVGASTSTTARVTISACGVTLRLTPGSTAVITCGSVIVRTLTGSVQAVLDNGLIVVTIPAGSSARVSDTATGAQVSQVLGAGVTVTVNGQTTPLAAGGAPLAFASWSVPGFSAPVDNQPVLNSTKAGRAVPLKWHLTDASNAPVTNLTTATVSVQNLSCGLGVTTDELEETFAGGSGLQNLGNGDYQLNWKTSSTYAGSCKTMVLDLGGGVTVRADFRFTK
jgi:Tol biopolymer transport system component